MEEFFAKVGQVRILLDKLSGHVEDAQNRHVIILSNPKPEENSSAELDRLEQETRRTAELIRQQLQLMQTQFPAEGSSSVVSRIHRNQLSHMTLCLADIMRRHHAAQTAFRDKCTAQIRRQLHIVNREATDEELEQMLDHQRLAVFLSHVGSGDVTSADLSVASSLTSRSRSPEALSQIQARQQDLARLEASVSHLQQLFSEVAALLDTQGDLINNIEKNVTSAAEYVDQSREDTQKAVRFKKNRFMVASLPGFLKASLKKSGLQAQQSCSEPDQS